MKEAASSLREKRLRWHWIVEAERPSLSRAEVFVEYYGRTALFQHVGLDGEARASVTAKRHYGGQLYVVFAAHEDGPLIPMTPTDLERLAVTLQNLERDYPDRGAVMAHLTPQITAAVSNLKDHQATFARLNPHGAHFLAKFNAA